MRRQARPDIDWWEKLIVIVVFPVLTAGIVATASFLWTINAHGAKTTETIQHLISARMSLSERLGKLETTIYTRADAQRKHAQIWATDRDQYDKLSALKSSLGDQTSRLRGDVIALQSRVDALDEPRRATR